MTPFKLVEWKRYCMLRWKSSLSRLYQLHEGPKFCGKWSTHFWRYFYSTKFVQTVLVAWRARILIWTLHENPVKLIILYLLQKNSVVSFKGLEDIMVISQNSKPINRSIAMATTWLTARADWPCSIWGHIRLQPGRECMHVTNHLIIVRFLHLRVHVDKILRSKVESIGGCKHGHETVLLGLVVQHTNFRFSWRPELLTKQRVSRYSRKQKLFLSNMWVPRLFQGWNPT